MDLQENPGGDQIENVLSEDAEKFEHQQNTEVNQDDFKVEDFNTPVEEKKEEEKPPIEEKKPEPVAENKEEKKEEPKPEEKKLTKEEEKKNEVVARLMKPDTLIAFGDILLVRIGGLLTPDKPREYWALTAQDKKDLTYLLGETIKEENWTHIPTKYMLFFLIVLILGGKALNMNKPYKKSGDQKEPEEKKSAKENYDNIVAERKQKQMNEKLDQANKRNQELEKEISNLRNLLNKKQDAGFTPYEEIKDVERYYKPKGSKTTYDLETMQFTPRGAVIEPENAGKKGYTKEGARMGIPSYEMQDVFAKWKEYQAIKRGKLKNVA